MAEKEEKEIRLKVGELTAREEAGRGIVRIDSSNMHKLGIKEDASDEEVIQAFKNSGLASKLDLKFPSEASIKAAKEKPEEKKEVKK